MFEVPLAVGVIAVVAAVLWLVNLVMWLQSSKLRPPTLLSFSIWTAALSGCALTIMRRAELGSISTTLLMVGTVLLIFIFASAAFAGGPKDAPNKGLVTIAVLITAVEVGYLALHRAGLTENAPEVLALAFLPGIVIQIRNSGASKQYLLRLAARVTTFVVWISVALSFVAPALAYSHGLSDLRRLNLAGLTLRLSGLTPHPNFLSVTALICIVLMIALKTKFWWATVIVSLAAIIMAESRNAMLTLLVVAAVAWVFNGKTIVGRTVLAAPICFAGILLSGGLEDSSLTSDIAANGRFRIWDVVLAGFDGNPFAGWGPLAFQPESKSPMLAAGLQHAHNQVLQGIAEGGVLGGILIIALLIALIRIGIKHHNEVLYPSIVTICLMSVFTEPFLTLHLYGLNYAVLPAFLIFVILMSADAHSDPLEVEVVTEKRRRDLPDYLVNPSAQTKQALGLAR
ncbi:O-antigen ligase [Paenarthrobacter nicotinovorans]|uniref:O-antigen ligase n=1 Tax=Paenarthrobacter nicotinovorans TaxID=29320 RepID=A0ABT9TG58_PAENI|nr:O-antigen ligase family protein [Paenarthrobacter nicotinovorans]MDQ0100636.1 O-antigen ligase [Paenarthrobacter nicotinovorans]